MRLEVQQLWGPPPARWTLGSEDIHVWSALLNGSAAAPLEKLLSADELHRAGQFRFEQDRSCFVAGRGWLRQILSAYLQLDPRKIIFYYGLNGKPELACRQDEKLKFNLSHSGGLALYAISCGRELGIDLERNCFLSETNAIAARYFSEKENGHLRRVPSGERQTLFYKYWTQKEAVLKCTGAGIAAEEMAPTIPDSFDGVLYKLDPAHGYVASMAIQGAPFKVSSWCWQELDSV